jgi:chromosome segregation ATPase
MDFDPSINISAVLTLLTFLIGGIYVWNNVRSQVIHNSAKLTEINLSVSALGARLSLLGTELSKHELHVAETYVSKQGNKESTDQIMAAIHAVKMSIDGTNSRIDQANQRMDRLYEPKTTRVSSRS